MIFPNIATWMKKQRNIVRIRVERGKVASLMTIAIETA